MTENVEIVHYCNVMKKILDEFFSNGDAGIPYSEQNASAPLLESNLNDHLLHTIFVTVV